MATAMAGADTIESWLQRCVMSEGMCFKGRIFGCAVKTSGVWEATLSFTPRLPQGVTLNGVFYDTSSCMRVRFMGKEDLYQSHVVLENC
jgi:hypothetical protein